MNKLILAGLVALPLVGMPRQADAWFKTNTGIGANTGYQSGGSKSFLWGAFKSSDTPITSGYWQGPAYGPGAYGMPGFAQGSFLPNQVPVPDIGYVNPAIPYQANSVPPSIPPYQPASSAQANPFPPQTIEPPLADPPPAQGANQARELPAPFTTMPVHLNDPNYFRSPVQGR